MAKIEKTKSGKYHAYVYMGKGDDGKRIVESVTDADRRVVAREVERLERLRGNSGVFLSFSTAAESYIRMKEPVLSPSTIRGYSSIIRKVEKHFPRVCTSPIVDIDKDTLQAIVNALVADGLSPKTVHNDYGFVSAVLSYFGCPKCKVTLPEQVVPQTYEPTIEDVKSIVKATEGTPLNIPIRLAMYGIRRGEICALEYPANFRNNAIVIEKNRVKNSEQKYITKSPKNIRSNRVVPIDEQLMADIAKQGYVTEMHPDQLSVQFGRFIRKHKFPPIRLHDMRHFFAAYMHEKRLTDAQIMRLGGWATDSCMKRVYRYAIAKEETAEIVTDALSGLQK